VYFHPEIVSLFLSLSLTPEAQIDNHNNNHQLGLVWRLREEDCEFEVSLGYIARPYVKKKKKRKDNT
jgi:hypothetical protein